jgi:hypothetical protein
LFESTVPVHVVPTDLVKKALHEDAETFEALAIAPTLNAKWRNLDQFSAFQHILLLDITMCDHYSLGIYSIINYKSTYPSFSNEPQPLEFELTQQHSGIIIQTAEAFGVQGILLFTPTVVVITLHSTIIYIQYIYNTHTHTLSLFCQQLSFEFVFE